MPELPELPEPAPTTDERDLLLAWLDHLRTSIVRKVADLDEQQSRWTPDGALIPLLGIVNHLTCVEWRWMDGMMLGLATSRSEAEFRPGPELFVADAVAAYRERARATEELVRRLPLDRRTTDGSGRDLRWVLLHLIEETARHAGHADATRELLDGTVG
ncbi:mycothiol transferase [Blastococcus haudaquaticus]|uniref:Mini-circle protein n=1 Tax=Blastococcus haudaquaticus TaxID=1938745 RepID=A0A286GPN2_9ACTN|nr:DUF664 domain-containing protein [Blastococcus haudaquaticus]SOD97497.1 Protein of unknown function [Blastococcus haudaquaticus]